MRQCYSPEYGSPMLVVEMGENPCVEELVARAREIGAFRDNDAGGIDVLVDDQSLGSGSTGPNYRNATDMVRAGLTFYDPRT